MNMSKQCELCSLPARMYCESDGASLCPDCDFKIHSANFLVAKHTRTLLCQTCQAPTPWKASGADLGSALSVCRSCVAHGGEQESSEQSGSSDECSESDDADNQVVPLSQLDQVSPSTSASCSSSEQSCNKFVGLLKRYRDDEAPLQDDDDELYSTSSSYKANISSKAPRMEQLEQESDVLASSLRKFHQETNTC